MAAGDDGGEHGGASSSSSSSYGGDERLLFDTAADLDEPEKRGCLSRLRPFFCRCLIRARREVGSQLEAYDKVSRTNNPMHDRRNHDVDDSAGKIEITSPPQGSWRDEETDDEEGHFVDAKRSSRERPQARDGQARDGGGGAPRLGPGPRLHVHDREAFADPAEEEAKPPPPTPPPAAPPPPLLKQLPPKPPLVQKPPPPPLVTVPHPPPGPRPPTMAPLHHPDAAMTPPSLPPRPPPAPPLRGGNPLSFPPLPEMKKDPYDAGATGAANKGEEEEEEEGFLDEDENEPEDEYVPGGYHRVLLGDVYDERYRVQRKLGWGVYSTVWCCRDEALGRDVALKIQKAAPEYTNAAVSEIKILQHIQKAAREARRESGVVELLEHFYVAGTHGNHVCMAFELLGETLLAAIQERGVLPVEEVKGIARCLLDTLAFVHDRVGVVHTDIKPENVLLEPRRPGASFRDRVKLVDLGTAFYLSHQTSRDIQTREYRCPEGILGILPFTAAADVWSVGCLLFELLTGETLFDPQSPRDGEMFCKDESHLAQAIELLGPIPPSVAKRATRNAKVWFASDASLRNISIVPPGPGTDALARVLEENFGFIGHESREISTFLRTLLEYEPARRASAARALDHPWLNNSELL